jgi:hypothetical protein
MHEADCRHATEIKKNATGTERDALDCGRDPDRSKGGNVCVWPRAFRSDVAAISAQGRQNNIHVALVLLSEA